MNYKLKNIKMKTVKKITLWILAIGIAFLENGGSETAVSVAGAAGMYQFMPSTARSYNLVVSRYQDDRLNPEKATEAAMNYLQNNYKLRETGGLRFGLITPVQVMFVRRLKSMPGATAVLLLTVTAISRIMSSGMELLSISY